MADPSPLGLETVHVRTRCRSPDPLPRTGATAEVSDFTDRSRGLKMKGYVTHTTPPPIGLEKVQVSTPAPRHYRVWSGAHPTESVAR